MDQSQKLTPAVIQQRSAAMVLVWTFLTLGVYAFVWLYKTSDELRRATNDDSINPTTDLLLSIVTCGLWALYVEYRNSQKVHLALVNANPGRKDQSNMIMVLNLLALLLGGITGLVATYMVQEEYNELARAAGQTTRTKPTIPGR